jgi:hypothetical protein
MMKKAVAPEHTVGFGGSKKNYPGASHSRGYGNPAPLENNGFIHASTYFGIDYIFFSIKGFRNGWIPASAGMTGGTGWIPASAGMTTPTNPFFHIRSAGMTTGMDFDPEGKAD